ncbi:MAG: hypothetical protein VX085_11340, partial [Pseudomonadota bacterium]|nr:hypothetical protein [Pseudomonadota bacterium]
MLDWTDNAATRKQIIVDNPAKLYGKKMADRMPETLPQMLAQAVTADTGAAIVYGSERLAYRDLEAQSKRAAAGL